MFFIGIPVEKESYNTQELSVYSSTRSGKERAAAVISPQNHKKRGRNRPLYLAELPSGFTEKEVPLEELLKKLQKLMELVSHTGGVEEVTKKIERLIAEASFRKKHLDNFEQLTPREKEVLTLLAMGKANKEISEQLIISLETVKHYRKVIKSKLHISSPADLVQYGQAFNLI